MYLSISVGKALPGYQSCPPSPLPPQDHATKQVAFSLKSLIPLFFFFSFSSVQKKQNISVKCHLVIRVSKPNEESNTFRDGTEVKTTAEV